MSASLSVPSLLLSEHTAASSSSLTSSSSLGKKEKRNKEASLLPLEAVLAAKVAAGVRSSSGGREAYGSTTLAGLEADRVGAVSRARKRRKTLAPWESTRNDIAWRWAWLQLQIEELQRTRDSYSRGLDEYQLEKAHYAVKHDPNDVHEGSVAARVAPLNQPIPRRKMCRRPMTRVKKKLASDDPYVALSMAKAVADAERTNAHRKHSGPHPLLPDKGLVRAAVSSERALLKHNQHPPPPHPNPNPHPPQRPFASSTGAASATATTTMPSLGNAALRLPPPMTPPQATGARRGKLSVQIPVRLHPGASPSAMYRSMPKLLQSPRLPEAITQKLSASKRSLSSSSLLSPLGGGKSGKSGKAGKGKRNKRRTEDFDINNIVAPFAPATSSSRVSKLAIKDIILPVVEDKGEIGGPKDSPPPPTESDGEEDISDDTVFRRHGVRELREREKYLGISPPVPIVPENIPVPEMCFDYGRDADSMKEGARQYLLELEAAEAGNLFDSFSDEDLDEESDSDSRNGGDKILDELDVYFAASSEVGGLGGSSGGGSRKRKRKRPSMFTPRQRRKWERLKFEFLEFSRLTPDQVDALFGLWVAIPERTSLLGRPSRSFVLAPPSSSKTSTTATATPTTAAGAAATAAMAASGAMDMEVTASFITPPSATAISIRRLPPPSNL